MDKEQGATTSRSNNTNKSSNITKAKKIQIKTYKLQTLHNKAKNQIELKIT
jgi:hypothetical protein